MDLKTYQPGIVGGVLAVALVGALLVAEAPESSLLQRLVVKAKSRLPRGTAAPDFHLPGVQGDVMALQDLRGASSVLVFVTPTCPYCKELKQSLIDEGLPDLHHRLVFISRGSKQLEAPPAEVQALEGQIAGLFPVLQDTTGGVSAAYKALSVPTTYLLDGEGQIQDSAVGVPGGLELVQELVADVLKPRGP
jgi:peroxiredoxin